MRGAADCFGWSAVRSASRAAGRAARTSSEQLLEEKPVNAGKKVCRHWRMRPRSAVDAWKLAASSHLKTCTGKQELKRAAE